ncbi:ABC transporter permease subunit [Pseudohalocynthiibacter aestuariivivens]|nr:ABC transporter permease subunit [Pseudohalocynthiibacter aestuariivivens]QIE45539.1 ABC transporter permease subunit [Pseudohalocynthiibacter aestuariivivens]
MTRIVDTLAASARSAWPWLLILAISAALIMVRKALPAVIDYPDAWTLPIADWINHYMDWFVPQFQWMFRAVSSTLQLALVGVQYILLGFPWIITLSLVALIAWQAGGIRLAALTVLALLYTLISGYWIAAMNTLSLVVVALPLSVLLGFLMGYVGFRSRRMLRVILPTLDLMQTIPAFAYLIPILLLFGFGPVVGLIASVVFAVPPMVRNTILGFQRIPPAIVESARMSGCTPFQKFLWAELPTAWPQMLIGVNQTTMAALSMIIIAAIIGGFDDIGWEVLSSMRKAQFGQSLLSGVVIVLLAIMLDRVTAAFAARQLPTASHVGMSGDRFALWAVALIAIGAVLAVSMPGFTIWPDRWVVYPAQNINDAVETFTTRFGAQMASVKNWVLYHLLLPVKMGFEKVIQPFTWGFTFTPLLKSAYWALTAIGCLTAFGSGWWKTSVAIIVVMGVLYFGTTGLPWASVLLLSIMLGYAVDGRRLALFLGGTIVFLLINGLWSQAMLSVYLCFVSVFLCVLFGGLIGVWAAASDVMSGIIRSINDVLQTLPQFVLLIPALMLFHVGEFTALLAIIAYAIVPMIRYTEFGLRNVSGTLVDVGVSGGCSRWQLFWLVRLPQAIPQMLIGVNQTVLYSLGMLVIAALVGTTGLGQAIYVALGRADAGMGIVAGLGMALIAMSLDRILQAVVNSHT